MKHRCTRIVHKALAVVRPQFRLHFEGGIHGLSHWSRVWFHGRALATSLDVDPAAPLGSRFCTTVSGTTTATTRHTVRGRRTSPSGCTVRA